MSGIAHPIVFQPIFEIRFHSNFVSLIVGKVNTKAEKQVGNGMNSFLLLKFEGIG